MRIITNLTKNYIFQIIIIIISIIIVMCVTITTIRYIKNGLYYPAITSHILFMEKPSDKIQELWIPYNDDDNGNGKIHAWYYPVDGKSIILFCHGNGGNLTIRRHYMNYMIARNIPFLIFDYKGYGKSTGYTYIDSTYNDAKLCYDYLRNELGIHKEIDIVPMGESIGSFPASKLAKELQLNKLILLAGFYSISMVVEDLFPIPILSSLLYFLTKGDLYVGENLLKYNGNTLILHSEEDELVNYENAKYNFNACNYCKLETVTGTHNNLDLDWSLIEKFIVT